MPRKVAFLSKGDVELQTTVKMAHPFSDAGPLAVFQHGGRGLFKNELKHGFQWSFARIKKK